MNKNPKKICPICQTENPTRNIYCYICGCFFEWPDTRINRVPLVVTKIIKKEFYKEVDLIKQERLKNE